MGTELDLESLLRKRRPLDAATKAERHAEMMRRHSSAAALAHKPSRLLHPEEYAVLLVQAKAKVRAVRGPLPGDPDV